MKSRLFILVLLFPVFLAAQEEKVIFRLFLAGDAGEDGKPGPALQLLGENLKGQDSAAVLFLGDNIYPSGYDPGKFDDYPFTDTAADARLHAQLMQLKTFHGAAYVIPGNHDWRAQRKSGAYSLRREETAVKNFMADSCPFLVNPRTERFLPAAQGPGPVAVSPFPGFRLIVLDSQWPLQSCIRDGGGQMSPGKRKRALKKMAHELDSLLDLADKNGEKAIVAMHHPLFTNGRHRGHLFLLHGLVTYTPLKIFGWMGVDRLLSQDMNHPRYKRMRRAILPVLLRHKDLTFVSGHDHNLQCFTDPDTAAVKMNGHLFIVSGAGSKREKLKKKKKFNARYADDTQTGFFCVEYLEGGKRRVVVYGSKDGKRVLGEF